MTFDAVHQHTCAVCCCAVELTERLLDGAHTVHKVNNQNLKTAASGTATTTTSSRLLWLQVLSHSRSIAAGPQVISDELAGGLCKFTVSSSRVLCVGVCVARVQGQALAWCRSVDAAQDLDCTCT